MVVERRPMFRKLSGKSFRYKATQWKFTCDSSCNVPLPLKTRPAEVLPPRRAEARRQGGSLGPT